MLFNSWVFVFAFLPVTVAGFYLVAARGGRQDAALAWLLACSLAFYAWHDWRLLALILGSIGFNFLAGGALAARAGASRPTRPLLAVAIAVNLGLLGWFKYANFFLGTASRLFALDAIRLEIVLPLAISFFTFQQIAYLVDVSRGEAAERSWLRYALFVAFFPHLIAGPLLHHAAILRQFRDPAMFTPDARRFAVGSTLFALGLVSKVALADRCARFVDPAFAAAASAAPLAWTDAAYGTLGFGFQIYFDFADYSTMAIGLAALFGIRLPVNFDSPYKSASIIEFWRRWHITLSNFLRDYLYVPLGGNRRGRARRWANLMATMLLGGLWHGASWNFVAWGGLHGLYLVANHAWRAARPRLGVARAVPGGWLAGWALTFAAVSLAWVFFRAPVEGGGQIGVGQTGQAGKMLQLRLPFDR